MQVHGYCSTVYFLCGNLSWWIQELDQLYFPACLKKAGDIAFNVKLIILQGYFIIVYRCWTVQISKEFESVIELLVRLQYNENDLIIILKQKMRQN